MARCRFAFSGLNHFERGLYKHFADQLTATKTLLSLGELLFFSLHAI